MDDGAKVGTVFGTDEATVGAGTLTAPVPVGSLAPSSWVPEPATVAAGTVTAPVAVKTSSPAPETVGAGTDTAPVAVNSSAPSPATVTAGTVMAPVPVGLGGGAGRTATTKAALRALLVSTEKTPTFSLAAFSWRKATAPSTPPTTSALMPDAAKSV